LIISVLEVYQFARDASVAEAWLMAQDPYLNNQDLGVSLM
jgi:spectrin beta